MPLSVDQQRALNENGGVQTMFEYYEAAGKKAGIPASDIGRQFEAEYVILPSKRRLFGYSLLPYLDMVSTHFAGVRGNNMTLLGERHTMERRRRYTRSIRYQFSRL